MRQTRLLILIVLLSCIYLVDSNAQTKVADKWFLGNDTTSSSCSQTASCNRIGAGIDFSSGAPVTFPVSDFKSDPGLTVVEASASIADENGVLLFYVSGDTVTIEDTCACKAENDYGMRVLDANQNEMPNGIGLNGRMSSSQGAIIVPLPASDSLYYIFTTDSRENGLSLGFNYSVVDMSLNGGMGDVILGQKNVQLHDTVTEHLTAVMHCNQEDIWIITHDYGSNQYLAYLLTAQGIIDTVFSNTGIGINARAFSAGQLKTAPNGKKLAIAMQGGLTTGVVQIFDFDPFSGMVCNPITISSLPWPYGISFSPDNSKLYYSEYLLSNQIHQINLLAGGGDPDSILNSDLVIGTGIASAGMQIGPDGKIYISQVFWDSLATIENPNILGMGANFKRDAFYLGGGKFGSFGTPNFIQSYFLDPSYVDTTTIDANFSFNTACDGDTVFFTDTSRYDIPCFVTWDWNFDDPLSGANNTSTEQNPKHIFSRGGAYDVRLAIRQQCHVDTIILTVYISSDTSYLALTESICLGDSIQIGDLFNVVHRWLPVTGISDTGITNPYASPTVQTTYLLILDSISCPDTLLYDIAITPLLIASVNNDDTICQGDNIRLSASGGSNYLWIPSNSLDNSFINNPYASPSATTQYSVVVSDSMLCGSDTLYVNIIVEPIPILTVVPDDTSIISGNSIQLLASGAFIYNWTPNTGLDCNTCTNPIATLADNITYYVTGSNAYGCTNIDSVIIRIAPVLYIPNAFSPNDDGYNDVFKVHGSGIKNFVFIIYDRWGKKIFETSSASEGWDGKYKNKIVNDGVYVYYLNIDFVDGSNKMLKGNITLLK